MYVLVTFVPPDRTEKVLAALFTAGAGSYGTYDHCAFVSSGEGRFRPLSGADPYIGMVGKDERVAENRIELLVPDQAVNQVLKALRESHPYEEPAIYLFPMDGRVFKS